MREKRRKYPDGSIAAATAAVMWMSRVSKAMQGASKHELGGEDVIQQGHHQGQVLALIVRGQENTVLVLPRCTRLGGDLLDPLGGFLRRGWAFRGRAGHAKGGGNWKPSPKNEMI